MLHESIKVLLPQIHSLFRKHKIKNASVFGSAVSGKLNPESDVDFLVNLQENVDPVEAGEHLWMLEDELKALLKRNVDLITERSIRNPYFMAEIINTKQLIYE